MDNKSGKDQSSQHLKSLVGVLRCNWRSKNRSISTFTFGSATFLSPQIILTCGHNLYAQSKGSCEEIYFYPGVNGRLYESFKLKNIKMELPTLQSYKFEPISQQLALVVLDRPLEGEVNYPKVGCIELSVGTPVHMVAYSSKYYYSTFNTADVYAQPMTLQGQVVSIEDPIINHSMPTELGCSGGAIFAHPEGGEPFICGIHTHRGVSDGYNSGLYFSEAILAKMDKYFQELVTQNSLMDKLNYASSHDTVENEYDNFDRNSNISIYDEIFYKDQVEKEDNDLVKSDNEGNTDDTSSQQGYSVVVVDKDSNSDLQTNTSRTED